MVEIVSSDTYSISIQYDKEAESLVFSVGLLMDNNFPVETVTISLADLQELMNEEE